MGKTKKMKKLLPLSAVGLIFVVLYIFTLNEQETITENNQETYLTIASFNIQVFGQSKISKTEVMEIIAKIIRKYDIIAIQEVRSKEQNVIPTLLTYVNNGTINYDYIISKRLGRTTSKEQYAYIYNTNTVDFISGSDSVWQDPEDKLHREPYVASFKSNQFDFTLINIHTDPDEVPEEIDELSIVYKQVQDANPKEDDIILLGDLNYAPTFSELGKIPTIRWVIEYKFTNTRNNKLYDNILCTQPTYFEYRAGDVLDFQNNYNLTLEEALKVSDHKPIWSKFHTSDPDDD